MFELVVIWENGDKDVYSYSTEKDAKSAECGMKKALGKQIQWTCVRRA